MSVPHVTLNDGHTLPAIGFGTYPLRGEDGIAAIVSALETGYRLLDTAVNYENETEVGEALRRSGLPATRSWSPARSPAATTGTTTRSRPRTRRWSGSGLDYLDLHLIHWPNPSRGRYVEAWRALVELREQGLVRSIGVSNFTRGAPGRGSSTTPA